ncbi:MAG: DM13 domain-containing protein, partial [Bacteroidia bacterium]
MKNILFLCLIISLFSACKKEEQQDAMLNEVFDTSQATLLVQGTCVANAHPTSGIVKVYLKNGSKHLVFSGFKTDSGPDLRVYLSRATNNIYFIDLGELKSINGK